MLKFNKQEIFKLNQNLKLHRLINDCADRIVEDIHNGIAEESTDIHGNKFSPLSKNTIADKRRRGLDHATEPLYAEGKMKNVYVKSKATQRKQVAIISINKRDREIPSIVHNEGTPPYIIRPKKAKRLSFYTQSGWVSAKKVKHPGQLKREWFGVGKKSERNCSKIARIHIRKALM